MFMWVSIGSPDKAFIHRIRGLTVCLLLTYLSHFCCPGSCPFGKLPFPVPLIPPRFSVTLHLSHLASQPQGNICCPQKLHHVQCQQQDEANKSLLPNVHP